MTLQIIFVAKIQPCPSGEVTLHSGMEKEN